MAVAVYKANKWRILVNKNICKNGVFHVPGDTAKIRINGEWHPLGFRTLPTSIPDIPDIPDAPDPTLTALTHDNGTEPTTGTAWHITPNGAGNMDGSSWSNAAPVSAVHVILLQCASGDRVYFSEGEYTTDHTITLPSGVSLFGGFSANDSYTWATRDAFLHPTRWTASHSGAWLNSASNIAGQLVDGFTLVGYEDTVSDAANVVFRNMTLSGGTFTVAGSVYNVQATDCVLSIGGSAEKLIVSNTAAKNVTLSGTLTNATISLFGGTLTTGAVSSAYLTGAVIAAASLADCNIVNSTAYAATISGAVTNTATYNCNLTAASTDTLHCYTGDAIISGLAKDSVFQDDATVKTYQTGPASGCQFYGNLNSTTGTVANCTIMGKATIMGSASGCEFHGRTYIAGNAANSIFYAAAFIDGEMFTSKLLSAFEYAEDHIWISDSSYRSNYYIRQGCLYYKNGSSGALQVGMLSGWTAVSGYSGSATYILFAYGICDGKLYQLSGTTATQVGTLSGWTVVSGCSGTSGEYAYGICDGKLYRLSETTETQVGALSEWSVISGYSGTSTYSASAHGICGGKLYRIFNLTATQVGTLSGWTVVSGYTYTSDGQYAYGICDGKLYRVSNMVATQIGTLSGWSVISGYSNSGNYPTYAYGICDGKLYQLFNMAATQVGTLSGWSVVNGYSGYSGEYAYGICDGKLYRLFETTATQVGALSGWTAVSGTCRLSIPTYAYGICNGKLYQLFETTATQIGTYHGIVSANRTFFLNSNAGVSTAKNCLFANCKRDGNLVSVLAKSCTFVNSKGNVMAGTNNVFWNTDGTIPASGNAQSEYNASNVLTLGNDNQVARFINTGYFPAQGVQDVGACPDPTTDPTGYAAWIASFGDFHPASNSFLIGAGTADAEITVDLDGVARPNPPTIGAYEPVPTP